MGLPRSPSSLRRGPRNVSRHGRCVLSAGELWGAGPIARHASRSTRRLARAVDEEPLRACPQCEQLVAPSREDLRYQVGYCSFCGSRDQLLTISEAEETGLLEPDGEGFWRVPHGPVPGWATTQPLPPLDGDDEIGLEEPCPKVSQTLRAPSTSRSGRRTSGYSSGGTVQQREALFRLLVKELRVMSREEILPTYKIPALVRAPEGQGWALEDLNL